MLIKYLISSLSCTYHFYISKYNKKVCFDRLLFGILNTQVLDLDHKTCNSIDSLAPTKLPSDYAVGVGQKDLGQLASELRLDIVHSVSKTGGVFIGRQGVLQLVVALHLMFNTLDSLGQDHMGVGHQVRKQELWRWTSLYGLCTEFVVVLIVGLPR